MARINDPDAPASRQQLWMLGQETNVETRPIRITMGEAGELLDLIANGAVSTVRDTLIELGGTPQGPLPGPDEVRVQHKLGRPVLYMPRAMGFPPAGTTLRVRRVVEGWLIQERGDGAGSQDPQA